MLRFTSICLLIIAFYISISGVLVDNVYAAGSKSWDLLTPAEYSVSNASTAEVAGGIADLKIKNPVHLGSIIDDGSVLLNRASDVVVVGNYAYIVSYLDDGMEVLDISDPTNPIHVSSIAETGLRLSELNGAYGIAVSGNYAYVAAYSDDGIEAVDISDPLNIAFASSLADDASLELSGPAQIDIVGNYAYVASRFDDGVQIIDISNPDVNIIQAGYITDSGVTALDGATDIEVVGNYAYVAAYDDDGVEILDISDPANPLHVGSIVDDGVMALNGARSIAVVGNYAYVAAYDDDGVEILDISDPANPLHVGSIVDDATTVLDGAYDIKIVGNYAYVSAYVDGGLEILDISDPTNPIHVSSIVDDVTTVLDGASGIFVNGNYTYVTSYTGSGLEILDTSIYTINKPYIYPNSAQSFTNALASFTETLSANSVGSVAYQVSSDNGVTWKYWDGSAWSATVATDGSETSTATNIDSNIATLDTDGGDFIWRAYLVSTGMQRVELDQVDITYDANTTPTFTSSNTFSVNENSISVGDITTTDPDGDVITYSISAGADIALFTIDTNTGALLFITAPDFESPTDAGGDNDYELTIKASDGTGFTTYNIVVSVTDIVENLGGGMIMGLIKDGRVFLDSDGDGISDVQERRENTNPYSRENQVGNSEVVEDNKNKETVKSIDKENKCPRFTSYYRLKDMDKVGVGDIQRFLMKEGFYKHDVVTGYYGPITDRAIRDFQAEYADDILKPWSITEPTGYWYKTTRIKANELVGCPEEYGDIKSLIELG